MGSKEDDVHGWHERKKAEWLGEKTSMNHLPQTSVWEIEPRSCALKKNENSSSFGVFRKSPSGSFFRLKPSCLLAVVHIGRGLAVGLVLTGARKICSG